MMDDMSPAEASPPQSQGVAFTLATMPGPEAGRAERVRYWLYKYLGTLLMVRANHGDVVMSLERTSYAIVLLIALRTWCSGQEIPSTMASFLNVLVGAVLGQGALSTAGFLIRTKAAAPSEQSPQ